MLVRRNGSLELRTVTVFFATENKKLEMSECYFTSNDGNNENISSQRRHKRG